eukprot:COSAG02_NODE_31730_length_528_cov_1.053613_1_plen_50_part_00
MSLTKELSPGRREDTTRQFVKDATEIAYARFANDINGLLTVVDAVAEVE